jgi:tRNA uridine 5-carboxymethylaminomethyl modification enzyme
MHEHPTKYDVIVIGSGHAAIEAALAPARMGLSVLMLTMDTTKIGQMSCNPSIGGIAKGQVVREIDALGGEMARATDEAGVQFRMLNKGKGPAVWSPRAQCDRALYREVMTRTVHAQENLEVRQGEAVRILTDERGVAGVQAADGVLYKGRAVVLGTGTFLKGLLHRGLTSFAGGRLDERPASHLSDSLRKLGFEVGRLKTGTPMRLDGRTIDYSRCEIQPGDEPPIPFSHGTARLAQKQLPCWLTYTTQQAHRCILDNLDRSPLYSGRIKSTGVRYCPSIEDKVVKFPHHERHHVFIEPEGYGTDEVYVNGLFTSLPEDVQENMVHAIPGLENAQFIRYGYAVEYDYCPPTQVRSTLETKLVPRLYFAGQINGTTGYEEAGGQGLMAGINAALALKSEPPLVLGRDEAYIGVMIDDLVTKGVDEPYRLLSSRAEYRLHLRWDNADLRLMDYGRRVGLIPEEQHEKFQAYRDEVARRLAEPDTGVRPVEDRIDYQAWITRKYEGYIRRQEADIARFHRMESRRIPPDFDFNEPIGFLTEARQKFCRVVPESIGQASRIPGVTPADINILLVYLEKRRRRQAETVRGNCD